MLLQLNPSAGDNLGKCLFPLKKAQELNLQALGLLVKWHRLVFRQGSCSSPGKQPERRIWDGYELCDQFGGFFFPIGSKVHQEFGVVSNGLAPDLGGNLSWSCWPLNKGCV